MINTGILKAVVRSQCTDLGCWMVAIHKFRSQCTDLGRWMVAMHKFRSQCADLGRWMVAIHRFRSQCTDIFRSQDGRFPALWGGGGLLYYYALSKIDGSTSICVLTTRLSNQF